MSDSKKLVLATGMLLTATRPSDGKILLFGRMRGGFNPETVKGSKEGRQSFRGGFQPILHGKHEGEGDTVEGRKLALLRETYEELGGRWLTIVMKRWAARTWDPYHTYIEGGQSVWVYHIHVEWSDLADLPIDCVEYIPLCDTKSIKKLEDYGSTGVQDRNVFAMFNGQREAVLKLAKELREI